MSDPRPPDDRRDAKRDERDERELARLFAEAGPRPDVPAADLEAALSAARFAWARKVRDHAAEPAPAEALLPGPRPAAGRWMAVAGVAVAAALLLVLGMRLGLAGRAGVDRGAVASVEVTLGSLEVRSGEGWSALAPGDELAAGAELRTGAEGRAALRTGAGASLRIDRASRLLLASGQRIELRSGSVYADTGTGAGARGLVVATPVGEARDVGTRFAVTAEAGAMRVAVRDGAVVVERGGERFRAERGDALEVGREGEPVRSEVPAWGDAWSWTLGVAPPFELEGATLAEFLAWLAAETGWTVRYDQDAVGEPAERIVLHGSLEGVGPLDAADLVLPGAEVSYRLVDGVLYVE
jgi:hypothetical protein